MLNVCGEINCKWYHVYIGIAQGHFKNKASKRPLYTHPFWQGVFVMALGNTMQPKQTT